MVMSTRHKGRQAEETASFHLAARGWRVLAENYVTPLGEIDIVAEDAGTLVMVEVKARSSPFFGEALEAIGPRKERRLRAAAAWWMAENGRVTHLVRFDVVAVQMTPDGTPCSLLHLPDVLGSGR